MSKVITYINIPSSLDTENIEQLTSNVANLQPGSLGVLRGSGEAFCLGMNLTMAHGLDEERLRAGLQAYADLLLALRTAPCVLIAAVEGGAFGGGVGLAAACDLVLASDSARFGLPEALYGFYPAIVFAVLNERVAHQKARLLALLCESLSANEAHDVGLVDVLIEAGYFEISLQRQIRRLSRADAAGVLGIKCHAAHLGNLHAALSHGVEATLASLLTPDVRERLAREVAA